MLQSHLKLYINELIEHDPSPTHGPRLRAFLASAMTDDVRRGVLERKNALQLASFYVAEGNLDRARYYTAQALQAFVAEWTELHPLLISSRNAALQVHADCRFVSSF